MRRGELNKFSFFASLLIKVTGQVQILSMVTKLKVWSVSLSAPI